jgi:ribonuclease PH
MNLVITGGNKFVEVQATAERMPFDDTEMAGLLGLARTGISELRMLQQQVLASRTPA